MNPESPIYIPSKGRWSIRRTSDALERMKVPYCIIVEEQEYTQYAAVVDKKKILVLDKSFQRDYETCDDLGDSKSKGPGPARNFAWQHAIDNSHAWHWVMDDNISWFARLNRSKKTKVGDGTIFRCIEDYVNRYENVGMAGPAYYFCAKARQKLNPVILNTRIYSCNLIRNDVPFRWRGRYNEDTILSLDMLKAGWCTIQFNSFLQGKVATQTTKGGNTAEFYAKEGTLPKSQMQVKVHPDVSRLVWRFGRWHHYVDYKRFKYMRLKKKPSIEIPKGINNYGMRLKKREQ